MTLKQSEALANKQCKVARGHFQKAAEGYKKGITDYLTGKIPYMPNFDDEYRLIGCCMELITPAYIENYNVKWYGCKRYKEDAEKAVCILESALDEMGEYRKRLANIKRATKKLVQSVNALNYPEVSTAS